MAIGCCHGTLLPYKLATPVYLKLTIHVRIANVCCLSPADFRAERNILPKFAYPELQSFCQERGLDFQVTAVVAIGDVTT